MKYLILWKKLNETLRWKQFFLDLEEKQKILIWSEL